MNSNPAHFNGANYRDFPVAMAIVISVYVIIYPIEISLEYAHYIWNTTLILTVYLMSCLFINVVKIYEEEIVFIYPTRIFFRNRRMQICKIKKVRIAHSWYEPTIGFFKNDKKRIALPTNSFHCRNEKKIARIVEYFQSKGIDVEIV